MPQCSVTAYRDDKSPNTRGVSGGGISTSSGDGTRGAGESATEEFIVAVKYVRREIRSLTDRDREVFLNAMAVMQRVPSAVGRAIYGRNYYSKDYFNRMHLYYGARTTKVSRAGPLISKAVEINALLLCVAPPVGYRYGTDRGDIVASMYGAYNTTGFRDYTSLCGEIRYFAEKHGSGITRLCAGKYDISRKSTLWYGAFICVCLSLAISPDTTQLASAVVMIGDKTTPFRHPVLPESQAVPASETVPTRRHFAG